MTEQLKKLLPYKKSKQWMAQRLKCTVEEVDKMLAELHIKPRAIRASSANFVQTTLPFPDTSVTYSWTTAVDKETGTLKSEIICDFEPKDDIELAALHKVDLTKYKISHYHTSLKANGKFLSSLFCKLISNTGFSGKEFMSFLETYKPPKLNLSKKSKKLIKIGPNGCLIINKQDEHINKLDIDGENHMFERMVNVLDKIEIILEQASISNNLQSIAYIIGSDEFNSEWTSLTTKGTPQSNVMGYQEAFKEICDYEVAVITKLLEYSDEVKVIYLPGNHDEYVGWHLINWLKSFFREVVEIKFDEETKYRKYLQYSNTGIMLNHGDAIKPEKLAGMFPIEFKEEWSECDNYYIFTGDKHHLLAKDFNGIQFYQIPSLSKAISLWDDKNGHTCSKAELTAFLIEEGEGMTNIYKRPL